MLIVSWLCPLDNESETNTHAERTHVWDPPVDAASEQAKQKHNCWLDKVAQQKKPTCTSIKRHKEKLHGVTLEKLILFRNFVKYTDDILFLFTQSTLHSKVHIKHDNEYKQTMFVNIWPENPGGNNQHYTQTRTHAKTAIG